MRFCHKKNGCKKYGNSIFSNVILISSSGNKIAKSAPERKNVNNMEYYLIIRL